MNKIIKTLGLLILLSTNGLFAQEPDQPSTRASKMTTQEVRDTDTGDIVLDYRGLIQKIDDMRQHEEEVLRKLEDLTRSYEDGLRRIEETQKKLEDQIDEFQDWHDKAMDKMEAMDRAWAEPQEIRGEMRDKPSDRYKSSYPK